MSNCGGRNLCFFEVMSSSGKTNNLNTEPSLSKHSHEHLSVNTFGRQFEVEWGCAWRSSGRYKWSFHCLVCRSNTAKHLQRWRKHSSKHGGFFVVWCLSIRERVLSKHSSTVFIFEKKKSERFKLPHFCSCSMQEIIIKKWCSGERESEQVYPDCQLVWRPTDYYSM